LRKYIDVEEVDKQIKLKDYLISNVELVPKWEISTIEETVPYTNEEGNIVGVTSRIVKTSTITLTPKEVKDVAVQKQETTKMDVRK